MDYTDAIHIIPDAAGPDAWTTEDDYRQWNAADPGKKARGGGGGSATRRSRGIGKMFLKTKLCCNFRSGTCPYVTTCNFAHGMEELRNRNRKPRAARRTGVSPSYVMDVVAGTSAPPPPAAAPVCTAETLPTPTLRRVLGCQTAAVDRRPGLPRTGAWNPAALGLPSAEVLNMNGYGGGFYSPDEGESSSN